MHKNFVDRAVGDELMSLTGALTIYYAAVTIAHYYLLPPADAKIMIPLAAVTTFLLLALFVRIYRMPVDEKWSQPLAFYVAALALINCVVHLYIVGKAENSTNFALLMAASGWLILSRIWFGAIALLIGGSWLVVAFAAPPGENWAHYGFLLLGATALGIIIQSARRTTLRRLVRAELDRKVFIEHLESLLGERNEQLQASQNKLRQSERLASVGTLTAGIAHEINNPLGLLLIATEFMKRQLADPPARLELEPLVDQIAEYGIRCAQIVKNVLRFAQNEFTDRRLMDVNCSIRKAVDLTKIYAAERAATIDASLAPSLPLILVNPLDMEQVFVNLINNGIESSNRAARLVIRSEAAGTAIRITIADNGRGLKSAERTQIFSPFYTTRRSEGGTGLGLSLVERILSDHGGAISISSNEGEGTTVIVELPIRPT